MEIVGDAVHDYTLQMGGMGRRIVALGIATWGLVANKVSLTVSDVSNAEVLTSALKLQIAAKFFLSHHILRMK